MSNQLLTRKEVEALTRLSTTTIYRKVREGSLPEALKVGEPAVRWQPNDIEAWLAEWLVSAFKPREAPPPPAPDKHIGRESARGRAICGCPEQAVNQATENDMNKWKMIVDGVLLGTVDLPPNTNPHSVPTHFDLSVFDANKSAFTVECSATGFRETIPMRGYPPRPMFAGQ